MNRTRSFLLGFAGTVAFTLAVSALWPSALSAIQYQITRAPQLFTGTTVISGETTLSGTTTISGAVTQSGTWSATGSTSAISSATTTFSGAAINLTKATTLGTVTSNGLYQWVWSAGNAGAVLFADSLSTTGPVFLTSTNTLSGTTEVSGAATFSNAAPVHFHGYSGIATVSVGKDSITTTVTGAATTDLVFATLRTDQARSVQHAYISSTNNSQSI